MSDRDYDLTDATPLPRLPFEDDELGHDDAPELDELSAIVERELAQDYVASGEALRQIRDEQLFRPRYASFNAYFQERYDLHPETARVHIRASEVALDLQGRFDRRLPLVHANLLYRFDSDKRVEVAHRIHLLSQRDATHVVLQETKEAKKKGKQKERHAPDSDVRALSSWVEDGNRFDLVSILDGMSELGRQALQRDMRALRRRLHAADGARTPERQIDLCPPIPDDGGAA